MEQMHYVDMKGHTILAPPKPVGYWKMPGSDGVGSVKFSAYKRPRWLTIKMMWYIFEWKWEEVNEQIHP